MAACTGCGRPTGWRSENECPCWLSVTPKGIIPPRLRNKTNEVRRLRAKSKAGGHR